MDSPSAERRKRELRRWARERATAGDATAARRRLLGLPELRDARTVALYAALPGEVGLAGLASELAGGGATVLFPRVLGETLVFHAVAEDALVPGFRGVLEPPATTPRTPLAAIDLFVVPGLLFDRAGRRLGRGLGLYDRALAQARDAARRVGLCYADRVVEELPEARWDVRMHVVVSDRDVLRATPAS